MADIADTFEAGGVVQARTTATIMARILAPVREVRVAPGDRVRAGQVLIVLDGRDLAAHARSARAAALAADQGVTAAASEQQAADAALALARATHERIAGLHAKRSATAQELDDATGALRAAEARAAGAAARAQAAVSGVESARAASEAAGTTASFALITAPFDGVVTEKMVEPGNMAAPGTPLMRVEDTRGFRLDVRVDESRIGQIARRRHRARLARLRHGRRPDDGQRHGGGNRPRGRCRRARVSGQDRAARYARACARGRSAGRTSAATHGAP